MTKSIEDYFADWENSAIGYGYGTGEPYTLRALKEFFEICPDTGGYNYPELEDRLTPTVAWLLISILCRANVLEYGSSPRFAWLTSGGRVLKRFLHDYSVEDLERICCEKSDSYIHCYPDACNCGPKGYQEGVKCQNPFWGRA